MMSFASLKITLCALAVMASAAFAAPKAEPAPDFTLPDLNGKSVSLADQRGKVVFIDFWATWCPPCRTSIPEVEKLYEKYQSQNVVFLGINVENDADAVRAFVKKKAMKYPVLIGDQKVARDYQVSGIPAFYIIDQNGSVVQSNVGFQSGLVREWSQVIDRLIAVPGKPARAPSRKTVR